MGGPDALTAAGLCELIKASDITHSAIQPIDVIHCRLMTFGTAVGALCMVPYLDIRIGYLLVLCCEETLEPISLYPGKARHEKERRSDFTFIVHVVISELPHSRIYDTHTHTHTHTHIYVEILVLTTSSRCLRVDTSLTN